MAAGAVQDFCSRAPICRPFRAWLRRQRNRGLKLSLQTIFWRALCAGRRGLGGPEKSSQSAAFGEALRPAGYAVAPLGIYPKWRSDRLGSRRCSPGWDSQRRRSGQSLTLSSGSCNVRQVKDRLCNPSSHPEPTLARQKGAAADLRAHSRLPVADRRRSERHDSQRDQSGSRAPCGPARLRSEGAADLRRSLLRCLVRRLRRFPAARR